MWIKLQIYHLVSACQNGHKISVGLAVIRWVCEFTIFDYINQCHSTTKTLAQN